MGTDVITETPAGGRSRAERRARIRGLVVGTAAVVGFILLAVVPTTYEYMPQRLSDYLIFSLPALAVGLIAGHARLINVGVGATFGFSAYIVAVLTQQGVTNPFVLMVAAIVGGVLTSVLFAIYAVVATGLEYLLLTLLTTSAFFSLPVLFKDLTGGENGLKVKTNGPLDLTASFGLDPLNGNEFYWLLCGVTAFWCALSWYLLKSRVGRVMVAIGRNPVRASALGYSVNGYRVGVTLYSGTIAASAGWLYALAHAFAFPDLLGLNNSLNFVLYSLIGGADYILGPLLGTGGLRFLNEYLGQRTVNSQYFIGFALLVVVYLLPQGVIGGVRQLMDLRHKPARRTTD